ncbi:MAG: acylneuraminate cytidylyltransferase family protein [Verrucomicrobiota bacterium]|nr:acylneuraminate cytidylyltransferase family protein [Verrucomicrobiota bacterium]
MKKPKILALIPARGGSKELPNKNILDLAGKPMITWTIEAALESKIFDKVVVSTDDQKIKRVAQESGASVPFIRPSSISSDHSHRNEVVKHALENLSSFDVIFLLQPTSPLRDATDIIRAWHFYLEASAQSCVSVKIADPSPSWIFSINEQEQIHPLLGNWEFKPRQLEKKFYILNGAIYITSKDHFNSSNASDPFLIPETKFFIMDESKSIDVDSISDFKICEFMLKKLNKL